MSEEKTLHDIMLESGSRKIGESFVNQALNIVIGFVSKKYGESRVLLGNCFCRYLHNATERYNQIRTLATGTEVRSIIGNNSIYVNIGVSYRKKEISTATVDPLLKISKHLLIIGTGGIGKSMLMRYLFLNTANRGEYIPIFLELRKIDKTANSEISVQDMIYNCMRDFDTELPREQFEYSLRLGKYIFLLDGFDEVKEAIASKAAEAIQAFCSKYPDNPCFITSRPRPNSISSLETFNTVEAMPLNKEQAIKLSAKIWGKREETVEFCRELESNLYDKHKDFAENPLLLTMMFLTYMRNNSIPDHLADFYQKAYDALFSVHDTNNKGTFHREYQCCSLNERQFRTLFSHFCFHSFHKEKYEFTHEEIISMLNKGISKLKYENANPESYVKDLCDSVCLLIQEGDVFLFSHRSFQTYFAACYSTFELTDEEQKKLFKSLLSRKNYIELKDYYTLLFQLQPENFLINALEEGLKTILGIVESEADPDKALLKTEYDGVVVNLRRYPYIRFTVPPYGFYNTNIIRIFTRFVAADLYPFFDLDSNEILTVQKIIEKCPDKNQSDRISATKFSLLDKENTITENERNYVYNVCLNMVHITDLHRAIERWLLEIEAKRASLKDDDETFLNNL